MLQTNEAKKSLKKRITKRTVSKYIFVITFLIWPLTQFAIFYVYMNFNNIMLAFKGMRPDYSTYWVGLQNIKNVFNGVDTNIIKICFWNNLSMFFWTLIFGMPLNILFAFYLYKKKFGSGFIRIVYMLPNMVSGVVMTLLFMKLVEFGLPSLWQNLFGKEMSNLIRNNTTAFGVQVFYTLWLGFSSSIIIYSNAMFALDSGMMEAAEIDGANNWQQLIRIIVPNIMPTISTYMITGVSSIFTISGSLYLFYGLNDVPIDTYMMGFYMFKIAMVGDLTAYPMASATSLVITVVTIPLTFFVRWLFDRFDPQRDNYASVG